MFHRFSFCKICEMYHVDWFNSRNLNGYYATHLTPEEKEDAKSFDVYYKPVKNLPNVSMTCYSYTEAMKLGNKMVAFHDKK